MAYLCDPKETIAVLQKYGFRMQKKFGQNFLIDPHVLDKILDAAGVTDVDTVLEIGPGIGTMTQALCERAGEVVAVEIDKNLIPILTGDTCSAYDNLTVINSDVLKLDLAKVAEEHGGAPLKVVANLPYYITTPIIMGLLEKHVPVANITVMVQKEVAERMQAGAGSKDYGALSLAVQYYAEPYIAAYVPPNCFIPHPGVGSAVIRLTLRDKPAVAVEDEAMLFAVVRAAFGQRRKTLVNSLAGSAELAIDKENAARTLVSLGFPETVRGEALTLEQFAQIANELSKSRRQK